MALPPSAVLAARLGVVALVDTALDALERALADKDPAVAVRAAQAVLDRVVPRRGALSVGIGTEHAASPSDVIRGRLDALREAQQAPAPEPAALPWDGEPLEGEVLSPGELGGLDDDGDWG